MGPNASSDPVFHGCNNKSFNKNIILTKDRPPCFEKNYGFVFVNFDCVTHIYLDFSQKTMFTL